MANMVYDKKNIQSELASIIKEVAGYNVEESRNCLFDARYNLSAELFVYILLKASKEFCFEINDKFVDSLTNYSFDNLVDSIINYMPN